VFAQGCVASRHCLSNSEVWPTESIGGSRSRAEELKKWERSRRFDVSIDLDAHWNRSFSRVTVAVAAWYAIDWFDLARPGQLEPFGGR
jgi:hypothetical protein